MFRLVQGSMLQELKRKEKQEKVNIRLQKYKKNRLAGMGQMNAAIAAGYSRGYAKSSCSNLEESAKISDVLERQGLTDKKLGEKHAELLEAKKVVGYLHQYKKWESKGIEKVSPDEVISNEFLDVDDYTIQLKALELAYKLKNHLNDKPLIEQHTHITYEWHSDREENNNPLHPTSAPERNPLLNGKI